MLQENYSFYIKSDELNGALNEVEKWAAQSKSDYAPYALTYIHNIPLAIAEYGGEGLKSQLNYVLANLNGWRGEKAKESKTVIKKYANRVIYRSERRKKG